MMPATRLALGRSSRARWVPIERGENFRLGFHPIAQPAVRRDARSVCNRAERGEYDFFNTPL
jgi:hypothetical protein